MFAHVVLSQDVSNSPRLVILKDTDVDRAHREVDPRDFVELVVGNAPTPIPIFDPVIYSTALTARAIRINRHLAHSSWEVLLRTPLPLLQRLEIVNSTLFCSQDPLAGVLGDFDRLFVSLTALKFTNIRFPWSKLTLPPTLTDLTIEVIQTLPPSSVSSPPELEPDQSVPSLSCLHHVFLSSIRTSLCSLRLYGIFPNPETWSSYSTSSPGIIHLPNLERLLVGGNGGGVDGLVQSLSVPSLIKLHIVSSVWSTLHSIPLLAAQMRLSTTIPRKLAILSAGPPYPRTRPSIFFTVMAKPSPLEFILECLDTQSAQWCHMVNGCGVRGIDGLVVQDHSPGHSLIGHPGALSWYTVQSTLGDVRAISLLDGTRWASAISDAICSHTWSVWPRLRTVEFKIEDNVDRNEVVCMGRWLRDLQVSGRSIEVRIRGEVMNESNVHGLLVGLPESTASDFRAWICGVPS